jgi:hypothetical protein
MKSVALAASVAVLLSGCAGYSRVMTYPAHLPRNVEAVDVGNRRFMVKRHPTDQTILIQPSLMAAAGAGLLSGSTLGIVPAGRVAAGEAQYRKAAESYAAKHGCEVVSLYELESVSWEAKLSCP